MEDLIKKVLKTYINKQLNLDSSATREMIANDLMKAIVNYGGWHLNLGTFPENKHKNAEKEL
jgi:hypothetical protein